MEVSCKLAKEALQAEETFTLLDCRERNEYEFVRLEKSILIPLSEVEGTRVEMWEELPQPIIVLCHHGVRSLHLCHWLRERGIKQCFSSFRDMRCLPYRQESEYLIIE